MVRSHRLPARGGHVGGPGPADRHAGQGRHLHRRKLGVRAPAAAATGPERANRSFPSADWGATPPRSSLGATQRSTCCAGTSSAARRPAARWALPAAWRTVSLAHDLHFTRGADRSGDGQRERAPARGGWFANPGPLSPPPRVTRPPRPPSLRWSQCDAIRGRIQRAGHAPGPRRGLAASGIHPLPRAPRSRPRASTASSTTRVPFPRRTARLRRAWR